ncbi:MATE family efflux transporter [Bacillus sp. B6(2022)]|nr:MATE family efflux transporter [Bacillus sp. B6(2022)]
MNHRAYLALAIPLTISTMTTPLLGAVDTAVVGQLANPAYIGASQSAVSFLVHCTGCLAFTGKYICFCCPSKRSAERGAGCSCFSKAFLLAIIVGICFIALQWPIIQSALWIISPAADVREYAADYFHIRIWGAPFTLMNYVILGWLMGMAKMKEALSLQILINVMNMILALILVHAFSFAVKGVAAATLISELTAFVLGAWIILKHTSNGFRMPSIRQVMDTRAVKKMFHVNKDLFIRTICLLVVINMFTAKGASFGTEQLAANAILFQIHYIMAYLFDGFANASSILVGRSVGANDRALYDKTLTLSRQWAVVMACVIATGYFFFKVPILSLFTNLPQLLDVTLQYADWLVLYPFAACFGLVIYGVFTGATEIAPVRNSMLFAMILFVVVQAAVIPIWHNHGLWFAFIIYTVGRSGFLMMYKSKLDQKLFLHDKHPLQS